MTSKFKGYYKYAKIKIKDFTNTIYCKYLKIILKNKDFSIIGSDCWAGGIYEDLGMEYKTPTVGLYFFPECFIKLASDTELYMKSDIEFLETSKYEYANELRKKKYYPIGKISDIEVHFLHYVSEEQAKTKWQRRKLRINYQNLFFSFTDNEKCTIEQIKEFDKLPIKKVIFATKQIDGTKSVVFLKHLSHKESVGDIYTNRWHTRKYFNAAKWLNKKYNT